MNRQKARFDQQHHHYRQPHHNYGGTVPQQGPPQNVAPTRMPNAGGGMRAQGMNTRPQHVPQQQQQQPQQIQNQQVQQQQSHGGSVAVQQHQGYHQMSTQGHHPHAIYYTQPSGATHQGYIQISPYAITPTTNPGMPLHQINQLQMYTPRYSYYSPQNQTPPYYQAAAPAQAHQIYATTQVTPQYVHASHRMSAATMHPGGQNVANAQQLQQAPVAPSHAGVVTGMSTQHQSQHSHPQQTGVPVVMSQSQPIARQDGPQQSQERKKKILKIVDPKTGRQVLDDVHQSPAVTPNSTPHIESASIKGASTTDPVQNSLPGSGPIEKQDFTVQNIPQTQDSQDTKQKEEPPASIKEESGTSNERTKSSAVRAEFYQKIAQASDDTRTSSSASTGNGSTSSSSNPLATETPALEPAPSDASPVPCTPPKEKSPSPEPNKQLVVNTPVANTSSDDSKDASLVSISPTPIENYATPRSRDIIATPPLQLQIEKYPTETADEEEPLEEITVSEKIIEPESSVPAEVVMTVDDKEVVEPPPDEEVVEPLPDEVKTESEPEIHEIDSIEENQPNGHVPSIEDGEIPDDDDDESVAVDAESGTDDKDDVTGSLKGKIKYDRDTLLQLGKSFGDFKVADCGLPDLARDNLNNHINKPHGAMSKNSPIGLREFSRSGGMGNRGNKGPMMSPMGHPRVMMPGMNWGSGIMIPPPPPARLQPKVQITLQREEVQLHKAKDAWKPSNLKPRSHSSDQRSSDEEGLMIDSIVKKTRGILNKLTPDNFEKLVSKFMELPFEDKDGRISSVISVVFEKAIDEPSFSAAYAKMVQTVCKTSLETSKIFRKKILDQCQKEFQKSSTDEAEIKDVEQKLAEATSEESREQLKVELEEKKHSSRRRSLGNVRFIGELYKLQMLTPRIMVECVEMLLYSPDEENLECLCKLLTTVGQRLDLQLKNFEDQAIRGDKPKFNPEPKWMNRMFSQLQGLSDNKKLSSRIRFAILDVVELRQNDWKPRRDTNAPKTIVEVHQEALRQEAEEKRQIQNLPPVQNNYGGGGDRDHRSSGSRLPTNQPQKKGDWATVQSNKASRFQTVGKKTETVGQTPVFGPPSYQTNWGQKTQSGSTGGSSQSTRMQPNQIPPRFLNRFQSLSTDDGSRSQNKGMQNSSEPSGGYRERESMPMFPPHQPSSLLPATSPPPSINSSAENSRPVSPKDTLETCTADTPESVKNIFQEYLSCNKFDDTIHWIRTRFPGNKKDEFIDEISRQVGEMSKEVEQKCAGNLVRLLIKTKEIPKETVIKIMAQGVMGELPDFMIDVPKVTTYLAQFLVEIFFEEDNLDWLVQVGDTLIQDEENKSVWKELAENSLNLLKLRHNEEFVQTSFRQTEKRDVIPVDDIPWLQDKTLDSLAEQMVMVLSPKINSESSEQIGQIFQEYSWDIREEITACALTDAICAITWDPETGWNDELVKKLLPLLGLPNQKMFPIVWKQVEDYLRRKSIDKKKGEGLWNIMYSLNMTTM